LTTKPQQTPQWVIDGLRVITACEEAKAGPSRARSNALDWHFHGEGASP